MTNYLVDARACLPCVQCVLLLLLLLLLHFHFHFLLTHSLGPPTDSLTHSPPHTHFYTPSFKGFAPTMLSGAPYTGIQMTSYEMIKRMGPEGGQGIAWQLVSGAVSGLLAQTVTYPGDTVRRRMQNNGAGGAARVYTNSLHCTRQIWALEGLNGFFKGSWSNTLRAVPAAAFQFAAYEVFKKALKCEE